MYVVYRRSIYISNTGHGTSLSLEQIDSYIWISYIDNMDRALVSNIECG